MLMLPTTDQIELILLLLDHNVTLGFSISSGAAPVNDIIFQFPKYAVLVPFPIQKKWTSFCVASSMILDDISSSSMSGFAMNNSTMGGRWVNPPIGPY